MRAFVIVNGGVVVEQHQTRDPEVVTALEGRGAVSIDGINPPPQCGWTYTGGTFAPPSGG